MSEAQEQRDFVKWFRDTYPEHAHCLRVSLGGLNFGSGAKAARMAAWVKSQGITAGESDIVIALKRGEFGSLVIEHKAADSTHKLSDEQITYLDLHNKSGNCAVMTRGIEPLKGAVIAYINQESRA